VQDVEQISEKPQNTRHYLQTSIQFQTMVVSIDNRYVKEQWIN
jgi:hypothetical protein